MARTQRFGRTRVVGSVSVVALLVAMVLSTKFVTPEELAAAGPEEFDAEQTAQELFAEGRESLPPRATPLGELLRGLQDDLPATAERLEATRPNDTTYVFPVEGTGTVLSTGPRALGLRVEDAPATTPVSVSLGTAINGTVLRDGLGFGFEDAPNQSDFQSVGDALKALMQAEVETGLGGQVEKGDRLRFVGVVSVTDTGSGVQSPRKPVSIQPTVLEMAP